jgi:hypothetical protein
VFARAPGFTVLGGIFAEHEEDRQDAYEVVMGDINGDQKDDVVNFSIMVPVKDSITFPIYSHLPMPGLRPAASQH